MTDLHALADAISDQSPNVKAFCLAVADRLDPPHDPSGVLFDGLAGTEVAPPWTAIQSEPGRVTRLASGAVQFVCNPGDNNIAGSGTGERAEVYKAGSAIPGFGKPGSDQWTAIEAYFHPNYPYSNTNAWNSFAQWHASAGGTQASNLTVYNGIIRCTTNGGKNLTDKPFNSATVAKFETGRLYKLRVRHHWSAGPDGFFAVSVDGGAEVRVNGPNLYATDTGGQYPKLGVYRVAGFTIPSVWECRKYAVCSSQVAADAVLA